MTNLSTSIAKATTELPSGSVPGLVSAFQFSADGTPREISIDAQLPDLAPQGDTWLWLHFNLTDARACRFLRSVPYLPAPAGNLLTIADEHQQLHIRDGWLYGVFADLVCGLDGITEEIGFLHFALSKGLLVSGRRHTLNAVDATRKLLRGGAKFATPVALVDVILEQMVGAIDHYAERLARELDHFEEKVLTGEITEGRQSIGRIRRTTVRLHRQLVNQRALMQRFELDLAPTCLATQRLATRRMGQRLDWLDAEIVALRDRAALLQEEVSIKTAEQTNRNLHLLAVVTAIFMPATLIAGIFGMNVGGLPLGGGDGFWWSMVILVGASWIVFWLLRRSGILKH